MRYVGVYTRCRAVTVLTPASVSLSLSISTSLSSSLALSLALSRSDWSLSLALSRSHAGSFSLLRSLARSLAYSLALWLCQVSLSPPRIAGRARQGGDVERIQHTHKTSRTDSGLILSHFAGKGLQTLLELLPSL